jgi:hypothetical protein
MLRVKNTDTETTAIFQDAMGRDCAVAGLNAGDENPGTLMVGLRNLELLANVNGEMTSLPADGLAIVGTEELAKRGDQITILRGAPMALDRDTVAQLIPILQHFVTHGTMPPAQTLGLPAQWSSQAEAADPEGN